MSEKKGGCGGFITGAIFVGVIAILVSAYSDSCSSDINTGTEPEPTSSAVTTVAVDTPTAIGGNSTDGLSNNLSGHSSGNSNSTGSNISNNGSYSLYYDYDPVPQQGMGTLSYKFSNCGHVVQNDTSYMESYLSGWYNLDGTYVLKSDKDTVFPVSDFGNSSRKYNDTNLNIACGEVLPVCLDRSKGEQLIIIGSDWSNRSSADRNNMRVKMYPADCVGFGNQFVFQGLDVSEINSVNGIDISSVNNDYNKVNDALKGVGARCIKIRSDQTYITNFQFGGGVSCLYTEGLNDIKMDVGMIYPFVTIDKASPINCSVKSFVGGNYTCYSVNISSLSAGMYVVDSPTGTKVVVID